MHVREVRQYESGTELFIPQLPFDRLVRSIAPKCITAFWFRREVLVLLQRMSETYLISRFGESTEFSYLGKIQRLTAGDVLLARRMLGDDCLSSNV
ncbi:histone H3, putative [Ixodes scapularis]|uniref:Histone H3, putative n=1 Tax=Ixodes scapularis TaxID=6945 RepID=B7PBP0_IXOSC|nr:histone H3, putative [Ixodes scapularis]|eukprot:XP_002408591.1 histone H3, putative [Ixodes scapularis]